MRKSCTPRNQKLSKGSGTAHSHEDCWSGSNQLKKPGCAVRVGGRKTSSQHNCIQIASDAGAKTGNRLRCSLEVGTCTVLDLLRTHILIRYILASGAGLRARPHGEGPSIGSPRNRSSPRAGLFTFCISENVEFRRTCCYLNPPSNPAVAVCTVTDPKAVAPNFLFPTEFDHGARDTFGAHQLWLMDCSS